MQVKLDMRDVTITLGNNGIELKIADNNGVHKGTLRIGQATVEWRPGKTREGNGKKLQLAKLLEMMDNLP